MGAGRREGLRVYEAAFSVTGCRNLSGWSETGH